ncbi:hypothetical protein BDF20DRAFT_869795 [Mycotypha africana]|uniref:uncharacterized protein n=1 Tax=Mycotypha africana TaxID=64632 RepID=UPI0022FFF720|nr:uncharacterized protein BDF20DRAFT_869795 [Mycotypha africana]KAI8979474.1 hypothetical protein BDF20DRAFT_869795 [Mycotypha africana]
MEEDVIRRIYLLTNELTSQQHNNQQLANELTSQLLELKTKASTKPSNEDFAVTTTAFIPPGQREEIIDTLKSRLADIVKEKKNLESTNRQLQQENEELQSVVKDYEASLETITDKFRIHTNAVVDGQLQQKKEYEALLNAEKNVTAALFSENVTLQTQLHKLSKLLRELYESDESVGFKEERLAQLAKENEDLRAILGTAKLPESTEKLKEKSSPVLPVTKTDVIADFFNDDS